MDERNYWLAFSSFPGVGPKKFQDLLKEFKTAKKAWNSNQIDRVLGPTLAQKFADFKKNYSIELYSKELKKRKVQFVTLSDKEYPELLKNTKRPPFVLYVKGSKEILNQVQDDNNDNNDNKTIAVVGTRKITNYGREVTDLFASELSMAGFTIVSGLALGVDAQAHRSTLDVKGKTIAVLGCGVDCVTPLENTRLYDEIIKSGGAVVSEFPLGHPPLKGSFPSRNRIIAGLSLGVLVTEGAEDSGSLITADYALKFKRPVFAVPGPITSSLSGGPFKLIAKGAKLVTSAQDILNELKILNFKFPASQRGEQISNEIQKTKIQKGQNKEEIKILELLQNEPLHFDEIVRKSSLESSKLGSILSLMEVKGLIKSQGGGFFSIAA